MPVSNQIQDIPTMVRPSHFLIVGLGNPGRNYRNTRHNIGFMVIDKLSSDLNCPLTKVQNKSIIGICKIGESRVILAKPQTFMNLSGTSILSLQKFYKIDFPQLLVIHDDVDVPFGQIRMRPGGGSAGQKGVESTIQVLGSKAFPRLRMGIGQPPGRMDSADYVLQPFEKGEEKVLTDFITRASDAVKCFISEDLNTAMNRFNPKITND
jgi:peptidyl-tRNA hydrolase, PTH1 family